MVACRCQRFLPPKVPRFRPGNPTELRVQTTIEPKAWSFASTARRAAPSLGRSRLFWPGPSPERTLDRLDNRLTVRRRESLSVLARKPEAIQRAPIGGQRLRVQDGDPTIRDSRGDLR